ncbi:tetratricopeptide repeat protein [Candidatus Hodarchaeum mangrovi]
MEAFSELRVPELDVHLPRLSLALHKDLLGWSLQQAWETLNFQELANSLEEFITSHTHFDSELPELYYIQAKLLFMAGDLLKLNELYFLTINNAPHLGVILFYALGLAFQGHTNEALEIINKTNLKSHSNDFMLFAEGMGLILYIYSIKRDYAHISVIKNKLLKYLNKNKVPDEIKAYILPWADIRHAYSLRASGQIQKAQRMLIHTLDELEFFPHRFFQTMALTVLGQCYHNRGRISTALDYYDQAIDIAQTTKAQTQLSILYNRIGIAFVSKKEYTLANDYFKIAINYANESGARWLLIGPLVNRVQYKLAQGKIQDAISDYHMFVEVAEGTGDDQELCFALMALAELYQQIDDLPKYKFYLEKGVQLGLKLGIFQLAHNDNSDLDEYN